MQGPSQNIRSSSNDNIDFNKLKIVIRNNWHWIALIFIAVNAGAYLLVRYTKNIYQSESSLKLDVKNDATDLGIKNMVEDPNLNLLSGEKQFLDNLQRIININKFSNITTLLNAVSTTEKTYGYGYYEDNGKSAGIKSLFRT